MSEYNKSSEDESKNSQDESSSNSSNQPSSELSDSEAVLLGLGVVGTAGAILWGAGKIAGKIFGPKDKKNT